MDFFFENRVSVYHVVLSRRSHCDMKSVLYRLVKGNIADLMLSWVVLFRVLFALSTPIPSFCANNSELIPWCLLSVIVVKPVRVILVLTLQIIISTDNSGINPVDIDASVRSNSWIATSSWIWVIGGAAGTWLWATEIERQEILSYFPTCIDDTLKCVIDGSQFSSSDITMWRQFAKLWSVGYWVRNPHVDPCMLRSIKQSFFGLIPNFLLGSVGSSHNVTPRWSTLTRID